MSDLVVVDTDILIDAGRGSSDAVSFLQHAEKSASLSVSVVTQMELVVGCKNKSELRKTERFLRRFQILKLSEVISDTAVELLRRYRLSHGLLIADALIAATALWIEWEPGNQESAPLQVCRWAESTFVSAKKARVG